MPSTTEKINLEGNMVAMSIIKGKDLPDIESDKGSLYEDFKILISTSEIARSYIDENSDKILNFYTVHLPIQILDYSNFNAYIEPGATIFPDVSIDDEVVIQAGSIIGSGVEIGQGSIIAMNATLGSRVKIGRNCYIGTSSVLIGSSEGVTPVTLDDNVYIGNNAIIHEGVHIGHNSVIRAGSIVTEDIPPESIVSGKPAKVIENQIVVPSSGIKGSYMH